MGQNGEDSHCGGLPFGSGVTHNGDCTLNGARVRQYSCGGDCTDIRGEFLVVCTCGDGCADLSMVILGEGQRQR